MAKLAAEENATDISTAETYARRQMQIKDLKAVREKVLESTSAVQVAKTVLNQAKHAVVQCNVRSFYYECLLPPARGTGQMK